MRALPDLAIALIATPPDAATAGTFDARVYALSPANVEFLRALGAWQALPPERLAPVHAMRIFGDDANASLEFDAYEAGVPALAWIVEDSALQRALWSGLAAMPRRCDRLEVRANHALISFADGGALSAKLVIGADGAHSFVRAAAGIEATDREYQQAAVVANFRCEKPHRNAAYQWFQVGAVLALLPLPGDQVSMVWSLPAAEGQRVATLEPQGLAREVEEAAHGVLGALKVTTAPRSFPLRRLCARRLVAPRIALVGDAAHVIHPLAGQGLNLGLQDVRLLAEILAGREGGRDPGDYRLLRRYERRRAEPIAAMDAVVSGLFSLYGTRNGFVGRLRNAGLNLTDRLPVLKNILMRQAMN